MAPQPMSLHIGEQLGSYEITSLLGKGGMGEVYRARDSKLKRDVAIKALPDEFSRDHDRLIRFQREAEVLASLNHSNIASIYDLEEANESRFLVMELVEGETLAERIARGPLPIEEALDIAKQISEALEAAHEKGIIHRDLKPANVKILPDGKVKVLDFGLAKALDSKPPANPTLSHSPTLSMAATNAGLILGTAAYMSPEQAKGWQVDRRTDIFAFGCVLYEMLTGKPTFGGDDVTEILASVVKSEPDWSLLSAATPPRIRRLLRLCLEKDRRRRLDSAAAARLEVEDALAAPAAEAKLFSGTKPAASTRVAWAGFAAAVLVAMGLGFVHFRESPSATSLEMRLEITTPSSSAPLEFALSPDGRNIVFVASGDGTQRLWLRALDKTN